MKKGIRRPLRVVPDDKPDPQTELKIRELMDQTTDLAPHLRNALFTPLLHSFARITLLLHRVGAKLDTMSLVDGEGELRRSIDTVMRLVLTQSKLANELGLAPHSLRELAIAANAKDTRP